MRSARFVSLLVLLVSAESVTAQQATTSSPQSTVLLQKSLAALTGGRPLTDVTLSGAARRIAGSDDESGTVILKALEAGASRMDLTLPGGNRSEVLALQKAQSMGHPRKGKGKIISDAKGRPPARKTSRLAPGFPAPV
jgi:hypothetical protein